MSSAVAGISQAMLFFVLYRFAGLYYLVALGGAGALGDREISMVPADHSPR